MVTPNEKDVYLFMKLFGFTKKQRKEAFLIFQLMKILLPPQDKISLPLGSA